MVKPGSESRSGWLHKPSLLDVALLVESGPYIGGKMGHNSSVTKSTEVLNLNSNLYPYPSKIQSVKM